MLELCHYCSQCAVSSGSPPHHIPFHTLLSISPSEISTPLFTAQADANASHLLTKLHTSLQNFLPMHKVIMAYGGNRPITRIIRQLWTTQTVSLCPNCTSDTLQRLTSMLHPSPRNIQTRKTQFAAQFKVRITASTQNSPSELQFVKWMQSECHCGLLAALITIKLGLETHKDFTFYWASLHYVIPESQVIRGCAVI